MAGAGNTDRAKSQRSGAVTQTATAAAEEAKQAASPTAKEKSPKLDLEMTPPGMMMEDDEFDPEA